MTTDPPASAGDFWSSGANDERLAAILSRFAGAMMGVFFAFRRKRDGRISLPFMTPSISEIWGPLDGHDLARDASPLVDRIHQDDRQRVLAAIATSADAVAPFRADFRIDHPEKGEVWVSVRSTPTREPDGSVLWLGHAVDITERVTLGVRYAQAQRLEAMGQLAGGIAHDFNNLLTVIIGNSDMLLSSLAADHQDRRFLEDILQAARRAASLTQRLLTFTRRHVSKPEVLRLSDVVRDIRHTLEGLIRDDIELSINLGADTARVRVDPAQMELLLVNLVVNARDAMPSGGSLTIATSEASPDTVVLRFPELPRRPFVELTVSDTGCGMTEEVKGRVFEPFFTTKAWGASTGLGLSTVFGIVRECGGAVDVESVVGVGSTFRVYLPAIDTARATSPRQSGPSGTGTETVLLVEDEEPVRRIARDALAGGGYRVIDVASPWQALAVNESIDLLISDLVMPGMSGTKLAETMCRMRPNLPVLYMTGSLDDPVPQGRAGTVLRKPFSPQELVGRVRQILDARRGAPG